MRLEIESAANFLSNLLRLHANLLTVDQLEVFRESIFKLLTHHYQQHWFPENPFKGSGYRCLRINHKMDPIIAKAGSNCGLDETSLRGFLPNELTLWIDPKEVSYRIGENGSICVLFDADTSSETKSEDGESSSSSSSSSSTSSQSHNVSSVSRMNTSSPSGSSVSSTASTLSSPSPSSSPDWSLSDRKSPVSAYSGFHQHQAMISGSPTNGKEVNSYSNAGNPGGFVFNANALSGHPERSVPETGLYNTSAINGGRDHSIGNQWGWVPTRMENAYGTFQQQHQQQAQYQYQNRRQHQQPQQHLQHRSSSPFNHRNYNGWDSFIFDQAMSGRHNHRLNSNLEQLATYVSS